MSNKKTILLAEDDPADQMILRRALRSSSVESELFIVGDGAQALDYLNHRGKFTDAAESPRPDLLIVNLNMPKVDGREVIRTLRADERFKMLPIVALTTSDDECDIRECYALGVNSYVVKPSSMDELRQAVEALQQYWFGLVQLPPAA